MLQKTKKKGLRFLQKIKKVKKLFKTNFKPYKYDLYKEF